MEKLLILLSLLFSTDNNIYIALDNDINSKVIKSEINRDWLKTNNKPVPDKLYEMQDIQCNVANSVILVDRYDHKSCNANRVPRLNKYPQYRVGEWREFQEFDNRTFKASGLSLMTINAIKVNSDADMLKWEDTCKSLKTKAMYNHVQSIIVWGQENSISDINEVYFFEDGYADEIFTDVIKKYEKNKGFPKFKNPVLPENPLIKFPWEP